MHPAVSPAIAARLASRPGAFLAGGLYLRHIGYVISQIRWWQLPASLVAFWLLGPVVGRLFGVLVLVVGLYALGLLIGPALEETVKLISLRTRWGIASLGAAFPVLFAVVEAGVVINGYSHFMPITLGFLGLRLLGIALHLYTHFVLAYRLSLFGMKGRSLGSFISAVVIHGAFNGLTTVYAVYG